MPPISRLRTGLLAAALGAVWLTTACSSAEPVIPTINTPPVAQAGGPYTGVVGQSTALDGSSSTDQEGEIASYAWTVEDGEPTELAGATPLYRCTVEGTFSLTLTVRDDNGAQDSDTGSIACVVLNIPPDANTGGPYVSRIGQVATLDASGSSDSDGTIVSWQWTIDDGVPTVLDGQTASYSCSTQGEFSVSLTVADDSGDTDTSTTTLQCVQNVPPTARTGGPYSVRIGEEAFLDGRDSDDPDGSIVSYRWEVDDDGPTVFSGSTAFYSCTSAETLDVTLTVTDNEGATGTETTTLDCVANVPPVADPGGPYSRDVGRNVTLDATDSDDPDGSIVSWVWSIADPGSPTVLNGETVTYSCSAAGTWAVTLTVADNDGGTSTGTTSVTCVPNQPPTAAPGGPYTIRQGRSGTLDGRGSTDGDGSIVSYAWSLDGAAPFSTSDVTIYTCTAVGEFDLTLTVTDNDGDSGSATTTLECVANVEPTADPGGPYAARIGESVTLDGSNSADPDGSITSWSWSVADGGAPTLLSGQSTSYTCTAAGTHDVILTVSDNDGATDSDATTVACQANALPTADAGGPYLGNTVGETVAFDGTGSADSDGTIATWAWTIADPGAPTLLSGEEPGYPCTVAGTFDVTLVVTDNDGDDSAPSETTVQCVLDNISPTAEANGPYSAILGDFTTLSAAGSDDPDGTIADYAWLVSDPGSSTLSGPTPNYTCPAVFGADDYTVTLTVTDNDGATGTDTATINCTAPANVPPTADANGPYTALVGASVSLSAAGSSDSDGTIEGYSWSIADGGPPTLLTGANPSYTCTVTPGSYTATLTVVDDDGDIGTDTANINCDEPANASPTAEANGPYSALLGESVTLNSAGSGDSDGSIVDFSWSVADAGPSVLTGASPNYTCPVVGGADSYTVTLTVTDDDGATGTDTATIDCTEPANVSPTAEANGPYSALVNESVSLSAAGSSDSDGTIASYSWSVDDGGPTLLSGLSPSYTCTATGGTYTATLTVTDDDGATGTDTATIDCTEPANVSPTAEANGPYSALVNESVSLSAAGSSDSDGTIASYSWSVDDGGPTLLSGLSPSYTCTATGGTYTATLTVTDDDGATGTDTATIDCTEPANVSPTAEANGPYSALVNESVSLSAAGSSDSDGTIASYSWSVDDGGPTLLSGLSPSYTCTATGGTYTATLTVTDDDGATGTDTATIDCTEPANADPTAEANGPYSALVNESVSLSAAGSSDSDGTIASYSWSVDDGGPTLLSGLSPSYTCTATAGTHTATLTVTDDDGATGTDTATIDCTEPPPGATGTGDPVGQETKSPRPSDD